MALDTPAAVILELMTMGQQSAAHLGELLMAASPPTAAERGQALTAEILHCCDRVIAAISKAGATDRKRKTTDRGAMSSKRRARGAAAHREVQSRTTADGFVWRKYGQKDINGSKHPRFYYRCAHSAEGCRATRRVQQSQDEPAAFVIAYYGEHTCGGGRDGDARCQQGAAPAPPAVIDFVSNAHEGAIDRYRNGDSSPLPPLLVAEQSGHRLCQEPDGTSRGLWSSSSSSSSEVELGTSLLEFLDDNLGWESVVANYLGFGDLPQIAMQPDEICCWLH